MKHTFCVIIILFSLLGLGVRQVQAKEWEVLKGNNFVIYYRLEVNEDFVKTVLESAEEDFRNVSESIGVSRYQSWGYDKRASIYIYKDSEDYVNNAKQAGWSHGAVSVQTKTIRTYPSDEGFFDALLPHELGHIILHEFVGPHANIPLWFDEGVAMYQEKAKAVGRHKIVQRAIANGQFIPLSRLTDMRLYKDTDRETVELFYAESASIVNFMITQLGEVRFHKFCQELKENTRFVDALPKVYMYIKDLDELNKRWVNYLKERS